MIKQVNTLRDISESFLALTFMAVGMVDLTPQYLVRYEDNVRRGQLKWGHVHP